MSKYEIIMKIAMSFGYSCREALYYTSYTSLLYGCLYNSMLHLLG